MYRSYQYSVVGKTAFTDTENHLLNQRNQLWNELADNYNRHFDRQLAVIGSYSPEAAQEVSIRDSKLKEWRSACKLYGNEIKPIHADLLANSKDIFQHSPLWWANKELVYIQYKRNSRALGRMAKRMRKQPANGRHNKGTFAFRFHKVLHFSDLLQDGSNAVRIYPLSGDKYRIQMTIHKQGKDDVLTTFWDFILHRPIPDNAVINSVQLKGKVNTHGHFLGQVTFNVNEPTQKNQNRLIAGVDVGWRLGDEGLLCATVAFGNEVYRRLVLPPQWVARWHYLEDLDHLIRQSIPEEHQKHWKLYEKHASPEWLEQTVSKRIEAENLRERLIASRNNYFSIFVKEVCKIAGVVGLEKLNLRNLKRSQSFMQNRHQVMAAPSVLQRLFRQKCESYGILIIDVDSTGTTMEHYTCEHFNKPSRALEIRCEKCGEVYNVDNNASDIIRRNAEREADRIRTAA